MMRVKPIQTAYFTRHRAIQITHAFAYRNLGEGAILIIAIPVSYIYIYIYIYIYVYLESE